MSLNNSYELLKPIAGAAALADQSLEARQLSSGRPVTIHLLSGGASAENLQMLRDIEALPPKYRVCFLETGNYDQYLYVVTDALSCTPSFRKWFASLQTTIRGPLASHEAMNLGVRAWQIPVSVHPVGSVAPGTSLVASSPQQNLTAPSNTGSDDLTRQFQVPAVPKPAGHVPLSHVLTPGEFTRMFQVPVVSGAPTQPLAPPAPIGSAEPVQSIEDEFTKMFAVQTAQAMSSPVPLKVSAVSPGEFTQMLAAQGAEQASAQVPVAASPPAHPVAVPLKASVVSPGEFTQMLAAQTPQALVAAAEPANSITPKALVANSGEFTQMFGVPTVQPVASQVPHPAAPGDPTQLFQVPAQPPQVSAVVQPNPDATLLFELPRQPMPVRPQTPVMEAVPHSIEPNAPGEFTRMFATPSVSVLSDSAAALPPNQPQLSAGLFDRNSLESKDVFPMVEPSRDASQPGEFTRMMESPLSRAGLKPPPFSPSQPAVEKSREESGFTRMMESSPESRAPAPAAPPVRSAQPSGNATRAFQLPQAGQTPSTPEHQGPSEFTNMFKAPAKEVVRAEPKPAVKAPRVVPKKKKQAAYLKWILVGSVALLLLAVIFLVALR